MRSVTPADQYLCHCLHSVVLHALRDRTATIIAEQLGEYGPPSPKAVHQSSLVRRELHAATDELSAVVSAHWDAGNATVLVDRVFRSDNLVAHAQVHSLMTAMRVETWEEAMEWARRIGARTA